MEKVSKELKIWKGLIMEEPVLKLSNSTCINKLIQYLTYHKHRMSLDSIAKHNL